MGMFSFLRNRRKFDAVIYKAANGFRVRIVDDSGKCLFNMAGPSYRHKADALDLAGRVHAAGIDVTYDPKIDA